MSLQQLQTGSGVLLKGNGKVLGFATGITFTRSQNIKPLYELDNPIAVELIPTNYSVNGALMGIRIAGSNGLDGSGLMDLSFIQNFFNQKYVGLEIVDRRTNKTLYYIQKVLFTSDSWTIQNRALITFSASFIGTFISTGESLT